MDITIKAMENKRDRRETEFADITMAMRFCLEQMIFGWVILQSKYPEKYLDVCTMLVVGFVETQIQERAQAS